MSSPQVRGPNIVSPIRGLIEDEAEEDLRDEDEIEEEDEIEKEDEIVIERMKINERMKEMMKNKKRSSVHDKCKKKIHFETFVNNFEKLVIASDDDEKDL